MILTSNASELLQNHEEMLPGYYKPSDLGSNLQSQAKWLK